MYVCICNPMTDKQIRQVLESGARTTGEVFRHFGHKVQCGKCVPTVRGMVEEHHEAHRAACGGNCGNCQNRKPANTDGDYEYAVAAE